MHNFLSSMPDLNFNNQEVQHQLLSDVEYWLEMGVDGFRLDTCNFYLHDPLLRDNPPFEGTSTDLSVRKSNPYGYQQHVYDKSQKGNLEFLKKLRDLTERYPERVLLGEIGDDDAIGKMAEYTRGDDKLHMTYSFALLTDKLDANHIQDTITDLEGRIEDGWPCWALGNHDVKRLMSRLPDTSRQDHGFILLGLLLSLRGTVCMYQGEELGLLETELEFEEIQDPYGITMWPDFKGRDGCRTPMPWVMEGKNAGFSDGNPWLPLSRENQMKSVDIQKSSEDSMFNRVRRLLKFRGESDTLKYGAIRFLSKTEGCVSFLRSFQDESLILTFNLSNSAMEVPLPMKEVTSFPESGLDGFWENGVVKLLPYQGFCGRVVTF